MSPTIRISEDVYEHLQRRAEPFVDTPDSVLRRLFGLDDSEVGSQTPAERGSQGAPARAVRAQPDARDEAATNANGAGKTARVAAARSTRPRRRSANKGGSNAAKGPRAPRGSLMKDVAYELPILQVLARRGGRAGKNEVIDALESIIGDQLTELDRTPLESGEMRWRNRAQFARLRLVQRGEMEKDSPRGIWELSEAGRARIATSDVPVDQASTR